MIKKWKLIELKSIQPMFEKKEDFDHVMVRHYQSHYFYCPCGNKHLNSLTTGHKVIMDEPLTIKGSINITHWEKKKPCHFFIKEGLTKWED